MKGIAIIPARGGSKGVPRKNVRLLNGKPLIQYSIDLALSCSNITDVYVSTEDKEIAELSISLGAQVPWLRPTELAKDNTPTMDVLVDFLHTLHEANSSYPDFVLLLQPTSPLRNLDDIVSSVNLFQEGGCDEVVSVVSPKHHPNWCFRSEKSFLIPYENEQIMTRRQELKPVYALNGAVYVFSTERILRPPFHIRRKFVEMPSHRSIDIDSELDFLIAKTALEYNESIGIT